MYVCVEGGGESTATNMIKNFKYTRDNTKVDDSSTMKINVWLKRNKVFLPSFISMFYLKEGGGRSTNSLIRNKGLISRVKQMVK